MSELISIENFPELNIVDESELTAEVAEGATTIVVENDDNFDTDHAILVGFPGAENAEIVVPTAVSDESVTVPALDHPHEQGEPVSVLFGAKARIYRASNVDGTVPAVGDFSLLATVTLEADSIETDYTDDTGGSDYWYLYTFYNDEPTTPEESDKDTFDSIRGGGVNLYVPIEDVRETAGLQNNRWIADHFIYRKTLSAQDEVNGSLVIAGYDLPLSTVPEQVKNAVELLASGYILTSNYGPQWEGTLKDGQNKIQQAKDIMSSIESGSLQLIVDDEVVEAQKTVRGYPDNTTLDQDHDNHTPRIFKINKVL